MSYQVKPREMVSVSKLPPKDRYGYFISRVTDWGELWSLSFEGKWVLALTDNRDRELVPVWPAEAFAMACSIGEWASYRPVAIAIDVWLDKWIPGMARDSRDVAVFPICTKEGTDKGIVISPLQLRDDLNEMQKQYL